jgi:uncharacterized membrane-anchored protein
MTLSLRMLLIVAGAVPPLIWLAVMYATALWYPDPDRPVQWPDPILLVGIVGWIVLYYRFVYKRLESP